MELRTLRYFVAVAQELNITRAAEKLNMSQPPLSNQMKSLEEELGATLFLRGKRHLQLTPEGSFLYHRAQQILDLADKTKTEFDTLSSGLSGTLYLGLIEGRAPFIAARWIAGFHEEYPLVRYSLWNGGSDDVLDRLQKGLIDLALIAAPYDTEQLTSIEVGSEPWVAIFSTEHPLARIEGPEIPLSALVDQPLIVPSRKSRMEGIRRWFGEIGAEPITLCETSNIIDAVALAAENVGVSIFPQTTYTPGPFTMSKVITAPMKKIEYVLVRRRNDQPTPLTQEFIDYVRDHLEDECGHADPPRLPGTEDL